MRLGFREILCLGSKKYPQRFHFFPQHTNLAFQGSTLGFSQLLEPFKFQQKILKALKKGERLNTSEVTRKVGSNFADTASRLELLEEQEILAHSNFGTRSRIHRFAESPRANAVKKFLETWEKETGRLVK